MLPPEARLLLDYMAKLWPKWDHNAERIALWNEYLCGPLEYERAKRAVKHYAMNSSYNTPKPQGLKDSLRWFPVEITVDSGNGYGGMFIECVAGRHKGRRVPLLYGCDRALPPEHVIATRAEEMRAAQTETYGGEWRTMLDPDRVFFADLAMQEEQHNG